MTSYQTWCYDEDMHKQVKGFTLIEVLLVVVLLSILYVVGLSSYTHIHEKSLDQRRKTDIEEIRSALEQYRSVNSAYPTPTGTNGLPFGTAGLTDDSHTYMEIIPQDPQYPVRQYNYAIDDDDYLLSTQLITPETTACQVPPGGDTCGQASSGFGCNYCYGSYGKK